MEDCMGAYIFVISLLSFIFCQMNLCRIHHVHWQQKLELSIESTCYATITWKLKIYSDWWQNSIANYICVYFLAYWHLLCTSSNGNIFRVTGPLCGEFTGHRSPVNSPHKGQRSRALMVSLICAQINSWVNNRGAGDLRRHRAHYDAIVMIQEPHWAQLLKFWIYFVYLCNITPTGVLSMKMNMWLDAINFLYNITPYRTVFNRALQQQT